MASSTTLNDVYEALSNLDTWYKLKNGDDIVLVDVPNFITLRWTYFRDRWLQVKDQLTSTALTTTDDYDFLKSQIDDFTAFIESQKNGNKNINPLADDKIVHRFYQVFNAIKIGDIGLSNEEQKILQDKIQLVSGYSKNNFLDIKNTLINYRDLLADIIGLSDSAYNDAVRRSSVQSQRTVSLTDIDWLSVIESSIASVDFILANLFAVDAFVDPFAFARTNANNPDINIGQYASGSLVKLEYGQNLESLATRYLGSPNRWIDIAIANGLKPPYIDEVGEKIRLLANGNGNQINIAGTDISGNPNISKFFINQVIYIQSDLYPYPNQRTIVNIILIPVSNEIILEVDGEPNLGLYKTVDNASIRVYLPNTISSSQFILIPSPEPLTNPRKEEIPWFLAKSSEDEKQAKIDIALSDSGDFNITPFGDIGLSFGLANAIQALKTKMSVELGELRYHPQFGFINVVGFSTSDFSRVKTLITNSIRQQIKIDSRFSRLESLSVSLRNAPGSGQSAGNAASTVAVSMVVRLAGSGTHIPISFAVNY